MPTSGETDSGPVDGATGTGRVAVTGTEVVVELASVVVNVVVVNAVAVFEVDVDSGLPHEDEIMSSNTVTIVAVRVRTSD